MERAVAFGLSFSSSSCNRLRLSASLLVLMLPETPWLNGVEGGLTIDLFVAISAFSRLPKVPLSVRWVLKSLGERKIDDLPDREEYAVAAD